ncbi:MAG: class I mannose-6-phosphate isomerase [bacterium]|nr:class I mannose-6-phosphate isomerase [bacterium]
MDILFLQPKFQERIWGGTKLKEVFGYDIPSPHTGECWAISARLGNESIIKNSSLAGKTLLEVYEQYPELFGSLHPIHFPLLIKIIDASSDLSVQVHPNDDYAFDHGIDSGKSECWIVLAAEENASIVYGHTASTKEEFIQAINAGVWNDLLVRKTVKAGDFINVPAGVIHALGKGIMVLESQQSSDTTYRLYDYDRLDDQGQKRQLHIKEAIEVSMIPHVEEKVQVPFSYLGRNKITRYVSNKYFTVERWDVLESLTMVNESYQLVSCIEGSGTINSQPFQKGDHFVITSLAKRLRLDGFASLIVSRV